ncbi:MAG: hypothetical protein JKY54_17855 [Flavobacteriales bacterium]|nr:hypothetical protein [Flavobacteriales bacterium]
MKRRNRKAKEKLPERDLTVIKNNLPVGRLQQLAIKFNKDYSIIYKIATGQLYHFEILNYMIDELEADQRQCLKQIKSTREKLMEIQKRRNCNVSASIAI